MDLTAEHRLPHETRTFLRDRTVGSRHASRGGFARSGPGLTFLIGFLLLPLFATTGVSQTLLKLSAIKPGTERVQLINNGDFQFQGPLLDGGYRSPTGWSSFNHPFGGNSPDMYASAGTNLAGVNSGVVASAHVNSNTLAIGFSQTVTLESATAYVLSAYLWNMGEGTNSVITVIDLSDAPSEPQILLRASHSDAAQGYFAYRSFNTSDTGTNVTVRLFYESLTGTGVAPAYHPIAAQWDNIAITKSSSFVAPRSNGSTATVRPLVRITSPAHGIYAYASEGALALHADAEDLDGTIVRVQFFAGTLPVAEALASPWTAFWNNPLIGPCVLTAVATDNRGATTTSAPVWVNVVNPPSSPRAEIQNGAGEVTLSWPASGSGDGMVAESTSNLLSPTWTRLTNVVQSIGSSNQVTVPVGSGPQYFRLTAEVDASTLTGKHMMGYQGWFACPNDGSSGNRWNHWFRAQNPIASEATVDFWPDLSELDPDELFPTGMTYPDGAPARLYSAYNEKTVRRHFKWMKDHHLDGVFLQRFTGEIYSSQNFDRLNKVADNVRRGAEAHRRVFAMMYDISGQPTNTLVSALTNDWLYLVNTLRITNSSRYLHHNGKPVVGLWGFGFAGRPDTPAQAQEVIQFFRNAGVSLVGGVPTYWRTLRTDTQSNPAWAAVFRSFDVISPWSVGRYGDIAGADNFRQNLIIPDKAEALASGRDYMPVIFPGFSWYNLNGGPLNQIPRNGGTFYWRQAYNVKLAGCNMMYTAMFDEVDEGTAMYKLAPTANEVPAQGAWVPLNIDGVSLPSDWYLRISDEASKMLRGDIPLQSAIPIAP